MQDTQASKIVTIFVNDKPHELPMGKYTGAQLKEKTNVPAADILYRVTGTTRHEIPDAETIEIHDGEHFIAVPVHGGAG